MTLTTTERNSAIKQAMILVWIGELWNVFEAVLALGTGFQSGSVALIAFGSKSVIELFLGGILIWQLRKEWNLSNGEKVSEHTALRYLGWAFFVLAVYVTVQSSATIAGWLREPETSLVGIFLVIASAVLMTILYVAKTRIAKKIGSKSLQKEAVATLACDLQDMTVLVGLGFNALLGWWWADPVSALLLVPFLIREGREALEEARE